MKKLQTLFIYYHVIINIEIVKWQNTTGNLTCSEIKSEFES